jgi:hypothetical protein
MVLGEYGELTRLFKTTVPITHELRVLCRLDSFTYATMFALESLSLNNETYKNSLLVKKACRFLLDRQMDDGGWGESFKVKETLMFTSCLLGQQPSLLRGDRNTSRSD